MLPEIVPGCEGNGTTVIAWSLPELQPQEFPAYTVSVPLDEPVVIVNDVDVSVDEPQPSGGAHAYIVAPETAAML